MTPLFQALQIIAMLCNTHDFNTQNDCHRWYARCTHSNEYSILDFNKQPDEKLLHCMMIYNEPSKK